VKCFAFMPGSYGAVYRCQALNEKNFSGNENRPAGMPGGVLLGCGLNRRTAVSGSVETAPPLAVSSRTNAFTLRRRFAAYRVTQST
jgi:hypothetical protein